MTKDERNYIIEAVKAAPNKTYAEIAGNLGVSKSTVSRACAGTIFRLRGPKLNLKRTK